MSDWLTAGAEIPDDPELDTDLTNLQYGYSSKSQIQLEKKEDLKARGLASPDLGDMLAMTFAVNPKDRVLDAMAILGGHKTGHSDEQEVKDQPKQLTQTIVRTES
jgi:hypothetical protein